MGKKIVFVHPDGLHQIIGATDTQPPTVLQFRGPDGVVVPFEIRGRVVPFASLYRVTRRAAYYKEPLVPGASHTFHEAQQ